MAITKQSDSGFRNQLLPYKEELLFVRNNANANKGVHVVKFQGERDVIRK